jgi:hypothetical protein
MLIATAHVPPDEAADRTLTAESDTHPDASDVLDPSLDDEVVSCT